jgi:acyl-CoA synthetase (AMP-forming)/AMP-acid ligase II
MTGQTPAELPELRYRSLGELMNNAAQEWPENLALIDPEENWIITYDELNHRAKSVAGWLSKLGLSEGDRIAIAAGNSLAALEIMSGALYRGIIPVPCNPDLGPEQLAFVMSHCDTRYIFATKETMPAIESAIRQCPRTIEVVEVKRRLELPPSDLSPISVEPEDDALIVYTSGTTGQPKGVLHSCSSQLASIENTATTYGLSPEDRFLCVLPVHHGNSINKIFATWLTGGAVVLPRRFEVRSFWNWVDHYECTWLALVPSIISQLLRFSEKSTHPCVRFARSSSAPLPSSWHREFEEKFGMSLMQGMGSTETGPLFSNPLPPEPRKIGSPGKSVVRQEVKIVDPNGNMLADNQTGLILARGPSQMKGYFKDPEATASVVNPDGWITTGDIGHRDSDGYFFVTGRAKEIVIKAGVNISLREIDDALMSHPNVEDAASLGMEDNYLGEDLVACVVLQPDSEIGETELLDFCVEKLGSFKTPTEILLVSKIPRLKNGKVQRHLLKERFGPAPRAKEIKAPRLSSAESIVAPRTPMEKMIARVWEKHLDQESIGVFDDFFALGGFSLLAIKMLTPLRRELGTSLSLTTFFDYPNIAEQALIALEQRIQRLKPSERQLLLEKVNNIECTQALNEISSMERLSIESRITLETDLLERFFEDQQEDQIAPRPAAEFCPLSFAQRRIWFLLKLSPEAVMYNTGDAIRIRGPLNIEALEASLNAVIERHEIMRVSIHEINGEPWQKFREQMRIKIEKEDLSLLSENDQEETVRRVILEKHQKPYSLGSEPLVRFYLLILKKDEKIFIMTRHHLVTDGLSSHILLKEIQSKYRDHIRGTHTELPSLPIQYGDFAYWQRNRLQGDIIRRESEYWCRRLEGVPSLLDLPTDNPRTKEISHRGCRQDFRIDKEISKRVITQSRQQKVSPFSFLAATFGTLLYRYSGQSDFVLGIPFADRDRPEFQNLVGLLLDTHIICFSISEVTPFREVIAKTRSEIAESYAHKDLPFELVVEAVHPDRTRGPCLCARH